jgi:tRNA threonylcarbamoyladenosine biosynthesis protein TsaE
VNDLTEVLSPSYTLVNEYPGKTPLVHLDFYRLDAADAARALGIDEHMMRRDVVVAVEWADRLAELIPPDAAWIRFSAGDGNVREIEMIGIAEP